MEITALKHRQFVRRISCETFRAWLNQLGLTQMECARRLNVDPRSVRAWALGERAVPGPAIAALELMFEIQRVTMRRPHASQRARRRA